MANVLLTFEEYEPTNLELFRMLEYASQKYKFGLKRKSIYEIKTDDLTWCDIVFSVRSTSEFEWRMARMAKKMGKLCILFLDDDFLSLGNDYGKYGLGYRPAKKECLLRTLKETECLLAVNKELAEKYVRYTKNQRYFLLDTPYYEEDRVDFTEYRIKDDRKIKIVFYVNDGTTQMFELFLRPIIPLLAEKYGKIISLYFLAIHPDLTRFEDKIEIHYVPHMKYEDFHRYLREQEFDIGLAPLNFEGFSRYKYYNKYIEYTQAGIAGIYTDCPLYRQVVTNGANGILCNNTSEEWMKAVETLVLHSDIRKTIAQNAQDYIATNFAVDEVANRFVTKFPEILTYNSSKQRCNKYKLGWIYLMQILFQIRGWLRTFFICIRKGKIKVLLSKINSKISLGRKNEVTNNK